MTIFLRPLPLADGQAVALAGVERARLQATVPFDPTASGAFDHATTAESTLIPAALAVGLSTTSSSGQLIIATTTIVDRLATLTGLLNRVVYTLEANGMTS